MIKFYLSKIWTITIDLYACDVSIIKSLIAWITLNLFSYFYQKNVESIILKLSRCKFSAAISCRLKSVDCFTSNHQDARNLISSSLSCYFHIDVIKKFPAEIFKEKDVWNTSYDGTRPRAELYSVIEVVNVNGNKLEGKHWISQWDDDLTWVADFRDGAYTPVISCFWWSIWFIYLPSSYPRNICKSHGSCSAYPARECERINCAGGN